MALGSSYLTSQPSPSRQPPIPLSTPQSSSSHSPFLHNHHSNFFNLSKWMLSSFPAMDKPLSSSLTPSTMVSFHPLLLPLPWSHNGPLDFTHPLTTSSTVNVLKLQLKRVEASPAPSVLSLTASSGFSSSSPETLSDAEDEEEDVNAGISMATATTGSTQAQAKVFRDYANACDRVRNFYAEQHAKQTMAFNLRARDNFRSRQKIPMTVWDAMERLNKWTDDSDPDVRLPLRPYTPHVCRITSLSLISLDWWSRPPCPRLNTLFRPPKPFARTGNPR